MLFISHLLFSFLPLSKLVRSCSSLLCKDLQRASSLQTDTPTPLKPALCSRRPPSSIWLTRASFSSKMRCSSCSQTRRTCISLHRPMKWIHTYMREYSLNSTQRLMLRAIQKSLWEVTFCLLATVTEGHERFQTHHLITIKINQVC